uniref:low-density lipoprotein receptor-related protein 1B-like n=1 Tax=Styela clava TaxID=7725 RepID=UPI00193AD444|nr:low-density lipoprotein receptor-related protein 1B-like [Styela clava]
MTATNLRRINQLNGSFRFKINFIYQGFLDDKCFRCLGHPTVISLGRLCDGTIDCPDLSDECLCSKREKPSVCSKIIWDKESELEQKFLCASYNNSIEISKTNICDGKFDCKDKIDENNCPEVKCNNIGKLTEKCNYKCQNERTQGELLPRASCFIEIVYIAYFLSDVYATKCDEKIECSSDMYWEECHCESESEIWGMPKCPLMMDGYRFFNCESYNPVPANAVCDGVKDCNNGEEEEDCANRFYCANPSPIHIDERKVCDGLKDCNDFSDELGCSDETHFYFNYIKSSPITDNPESIKT